jgi:lysyl-tRNA synthetase class 2
MTNASFDRWGMTSWWASQDGRARRNLLLRARLLSSARRFLEGEGYVEVDTPILRRAEDSTDNPLFQTAGPGGWPRLHLRTCPEEYTRRAACAFGKAFEIARSFRNERIPHTEGARFHLPEFTILEFHQVDTDLRASMILFEQTLREVVASVCAEGVNYRGREIDFSRPFQRVNVLEALAASGDSEAAAFARRHTEANPVFIPGEDIRLRDLIDRLVRPGLTQPTFLTYFPRSADQISCHADGNAVARAEFDCCGFEVGEVAELQPDHAVLREHITAAVRDRHGDAALGELVDRDYLAEVEAFRREVSVCGIGIERLLMILCDTDDIREVVWYPSVALLCER